MKQSSLIFLLFISLIFNACSDNSLLLEEEHILEEVQIEDTQVQLRGGCVGEITGPSDICNGKSVLYCFNSQMPPSTILWSGHSSIDGLTTNCVVVSGWTEGIYILNVVAGFPTCSAVVTKEISVCSDFKHTIPPYEFSKVCAVGTKPTCYDFGIGTSCITGMIVNSNSPYLIADVIGTEVCLSATQAAPFTTTLDVTYLGPCHNGSVVHWSISANNPSFCTSGPPTNPAPVPPDYFECLIKPCPCKEDWDCPPFMDCVNGVCTKKNWNEGGGN